MPPPATKVRQSQQRRKEELVRILRSEQEVENFPQGAMRTAMLAIIKKCHEGDGSWEGQEEGYDLLADCGAFVVIEEGDDVTAVFIYDGAKPLNLTNFAGMCYEFVEFNEEERVFNLLAITNNAGGHSFFVPDAEWVPGSFLEALRQKTAPGAEGSDAGG